MKHEIDEYIERAIHSARSNRLRTGDGIMCEGIKRVVAGIAQEMHVEGLSPISHLVHYTGMDVVFAMLDRKDRQAHNQEGSKEDKKKHERGGLRLYDTIHANDPEEGKFLLRHWPHDEGEWPWMWEEGESGELGTKGTLGLRDLVEQDLYHGHAYVLSFVPSASEEPNNDRIVFWREYGREGAGCSLSIPQTKLFDQSKCLLTPYRVRYGQDRVVELQDKLQERLFKPIEDRIRGAAGPERELFKEAQMTIHQELQLFRYLYKDNAYDHEHEYRLIILGPEDGSEVDPTYEQRTNNRGDTVYRHYMTHESLYSKQIFGRESQVILGPTVPHAGNAIRTIKELLARRRISGTKVTTSEISYRGR